MCKYNNQSLGQFINASLSICLHIEMEDVQIHWYECHFLAGEQNQIVLQGLIKVDSSRHRREQTESASTVSFVGLKAECKHFAFIMNDENIFSNIY